MGCQPRCDVTYIRTVVVVVGIEYYYVDYTINSCIGVGSGGQGATPPPPPQGFKLGTLTHNETYAPISLYLLYPPPPPPSQNIFLRLCLGDGG